MKKLFLTLLISIVTTAKAMETIYYDGHQKQIEISTKLTSIMKLPAPAYTLDCDLRDALGFKQLASISEISQIPGGDGTTESSRIEALDDEEKLFEISRFLKITPIALKNTSCIFVLTNNETIEVKFNFNKDLTRRAFQLVPLMNSTYDSSDSISIRLKGRSVFRSLLQRGQIPQFMRDAKCDGNMFLENKDGQYSCLYAAKGKKYKVWRIRLRVKNDLQSLVLPESNIIGATPYKIWLRPNSYKPVRSAEKGEIIELYIQTLADMTLEQLTRLL